MALITVLGMERDGAENNTGKCEKAGPIEERGSPTGKVFVTGGDERKIV
jgi:hypothetical protein